MSDMWKSIDLQGILILALVCLFLYTEGIVFMENNKDNQKWWRPVLFLFAQISIWIAIPLIVAVYVGKFLDKYFGTTPWIMLGVMFISFAVSMISITRLSMKYVKAIEKEAKEKNPEGFKKYAEEERNDYEKQEDKYYGRE